MKVLPTVALLLGTSTALGDPGSSVETGGSIKSYLVTTEPVTQSQNSLRLMATRFAEKRTLQLHYEVSPVFSSVELPFNTLISNQRSWRLTDLDVEIGEHGKHAVYQNLDRANLQFNFESGDLTLGRQAVAFGMARVVNPTDVFLPFDVRTFNTEYRIGIDAIRFQRPFGQLGELDFGIVLGDDARPENSAAFFQIRTNAGGRDVQFTATRFAEQNLIGAGIQTALGPFGYWFEIAAVTGDTDYVRASSGLDYAFNEDIYGLIEYHYNGAGSDDPAQYPALRASVPYQSGGVFLLGQHYLIPSISAQLSPLWSLSAQAIVNLSDTSAFTSLGASWNLSQNAYVDTGVYLFAGDSTSEYGGSPDTLYASLRFYF